MTNKGQHRKLMKEQEIGEKIRIFGGKLGVTTGPPRCCGWLDFVALEYAISINYFTQYVCSLLCIVAQLSERRINLAKLDVLDTCEDVQVGIWL